MHNKNGETFAETAPDNTMRRSRALANLAESVQQDLKFAWRILRQHGLSTLASILTLAIGIGSTTAIFSLLYGVLWRPLPYPQSERIVVVARSLANSKSETTAAKFLMIQELQRSLQGVAAVLGARRVTLQAADQFERVMQRPVTADFFRILAVEPILGQGFSAGDGLPGSPPTVVISSELWQRQFSGAPDVLGRTIEIDNQSHTIVGVAPPLLDSFFASDLWVTFDIAGHPSANGENFLVIGRLADGRSLAEAEADLALVAQEIRRRNPEKMAPGEKIKVHRLRTELTAGSQSSLWALMVAVSLVLLIACANVAHLVLTSLASRRSELALRTALGADRSRLLRQLLIESFSLSLTGALAGILLARLLLSFAIQQRITDLPRLDEVTIDWRILLFVSVLSLLTTLAFSLAPALDLGRLDLQTSLREGASRSSSGSGFTGQVLLVAQLTLCTILLITSSLLSLSLVRLWTKSPGLETDRLSGFQLSLASPAYGEPAAAGAFIEGVLAQLHQTPQIAAAAMCFCRPLGRSLRLPMHSVDGRPKPADHYLGTTFWLPISDSYFSALGIPQRSGRSFTRQDSSSTQLVAIVNEAFAKKFFGNDQVVGKRLKIGWDMHGPAYEEGWREIVGVVADVHESGLQAEPYPAVYVPLNQLSAAILSSAERMPANFLFRTQTETTVPRALLQAAVDRQDPRLPIDRVFAMRDIAENSLREDEFRASLLLAFTLTALLLVAVGVYGVVSHSVARSTKELGIRMAMGASPGQMTAWVLGRAVRWTAIAVAIGAPLALALVWLMRSFLYELSLGDWWVFLAVPAALAGLALLASYIPARRAAATNISAALGLQ